MWRLRPAVLLGAGWALMSVVRIRHRRKHRHIDGLALRPSPCPPASFDGVRGVLSRLSPTCLERALIWQSWLAARGDLRDVVIGVPSAGLGPEKPPAHAWVDGADPSSATTYLELHRLAPALYRQADRRSAPARPQP